MTSYKATNLTEFEMMVLRHGGQTQAEQEERALRALSSSAVQGFCRIIAKALHATARWFERFAFDRVRS